MLKRLADGFIDGLNHSLEFLCYADKYKLCLIYPPLFKIIDPVLLNFAKIVEKYLIEFGLDPVIWFENLKKNKNLITGSFPLWCLFEDDSWEINDIDIVGTYTENDPFLYWLLESHGTKVEDQSQLQYNEPDTEEEVKERVIKLPLPCLLWTGEKKEKVKWLPTDRSFMVGKLDRNEQFVPVKMKKENKDGKSTTYKFQQKRVELQNRQYPHTLPIVSRTYSFDKCKVPINHLHYCNKTDKNPFNYISQFFDVDFCKVAFDGEKLYVYNWNDIITQSSLVIWDTYLKIHTAYYGGPHPPLEDTLGYSRDKEEQAEKAWFYLRLLHRQQRYSSRGFKVHIQGAEDVNLVYKHWNCDKNQTLSLADYASCQDRYVL
jgi:hypothetical protein